jgi:hypothetical protein
MKKIILLSLVAVALTATAQDCKSFTAMTGDTSAHYAWRIVYNEFYKKFAIARDQKLELFKGSLEFLCKDHDGDYGVYDEGWEHAHCYGCVDTTKSLFDTPCEAKEFLQLFVRKLKTDSWR